MQTQPKKTKKQFVSPCWLFNTTDSSEIGANLRFEEQLIKHIHVILKYITDVILFKHGHNILAKNNFQEFSSLCQYRTNHSHPNEIKKIKKKKLIQCIYQEEFVQGYCSQGNCRPRFYEFLQRNNHRGWLSSHALFQISPQFLSRIPSLLGLIELKELLLQPVFHLLAVPKHPQ